MTILLPSSGDEKRHEYADSGWCPSPYLRTNVISYGLADEWVWILILS